MPDAYVSEKDTFERMRREVMNRRPVLEEIQTNNGDRRLCDYPKTFTYEPDPAVHARREELYAVFHSEVARLLGPTVADDATRHFRKTNVASTADHHGPLWHHDKLTMTFLRAMAYAGRVDSESSYVISLACANISFDNAMLRRGLVFHSFATPQPTMLTLPLIPNTSRSRPVVYHRGFSAQDLERTMERLATVSADGQVPPAVTAKVADVLRRVYGTPDVLAAATFSDQITITNYHLWNEFFPKHAQMPKLVHLEQEGMVRELLMKHHLHRNTIIGKMLFEPTAWPLVEKLFDGTLCGFDLAKRVGTMFFWALPSGEHYRQQLWRNGDRLQTADGSWSVALTPDAIREALERKELIPSTLVILVMLAFYYGIMTLGGSSQVFYLGEMQRAFVQFAEALGDTESRTIAQSIRTDVMGGDLYTVYAKTLNGSYVQPTGLDLIAYDDGSWWDRFTATCESLTVRQAIDLSMHEDYRFIFAGHEHTPELAAFSLAQTIDVLGLREKIRPCISFDQHQPASEPIVGTPVSFERLAAVPVEAH